MQTINIINKIILLALVAIVMFFVFFVSTEGAYGQNTDTVTYSLPADIKSGTKGTVSTTALNLRSGPGSNYTSLAILSINKEVTILDAAYDIEGTLWYYVTTESGSTGYVSSKFIAVNVNANYEYEADFEAYLTEQGFPESYKPYLRALHAQYPKWVFKAANTGLDWEDVINAESKVGTTLVASSSPSSWKSMEKGAYDFDKGAYVQYDSGGWVSASSQIIKYYMDPRNFLNQVGIFQFMTHSYDPDTQTKAGLQKVIQNTFMGGTFPESTHETYGDVLMEVGEKSGVNPYVLASMIIVEQGSSGVGGCISGTISGYEGYYNFFNIGAYKSGTMSAVERGLWYASQSRTYERPWNTRYKSILGGATYYGKNYVQQNKNTLYFKKFNVMNGLSSVGTGQYMTNVQGAESEAAALRNGYVDALNDAMTFYIPVYNNMPSEACPKPTDGTNNNFLSKLEVDGYQLTPEFSRYVNEYELVVDKSVTSVNITAKISAASATCSGGGQISLGTGTTLATIKVTSSSGEVRNYYISISREEGGQTGGDTPQISSTKYVFDTYLQGVDEKVTYSTFISNIKVTNGQLSVINANGATVTSGNIATGMSAVIKDSSGKITSQYQIVVRGDINGDGKINSADALAIQRHIVESRIIKDAYLAAADINQDGRVNSLDVLYVQKHIVGSYTIKN